MLKFCVSLPLCLCAEDVKRLNEKLTETSKVKMELQFKLDNIQSSEASVQVSSRFRVRIKPSQLISVSAGRFPQHHRLVPDFMKVILKCH